MKPLSIHVRPPFRNIQVDIGQEDCWLKLDVLI